MKGLGYKEDVADDRDLSADEHLRSKASILGLRPEVPKGTRIRRDDLIAIRDQGRLGSCTAFAAGQAVRAAMILERATDLFNSSIDTMFAECIAKAQYEIEAWSELMMYYLARSFSGETSLDSGTQLRLVFKAANKFGFPPSKAYPYDDDPSPGAKFSRMPDANAFRLAFDQRELKPDANSINYARIFSEGEQRVNDIKVAISAGHLVVMGTDISEEFRSDMTANNGEPLEPPIDKPIAGGHAFCGAGFDDEGLDCPNSWGKQEYGGGGSTNLPKGWFRISWKYVKWERTRDLWIVNRAPFFSSQAA